MIKNVNPADKHFLKHVPDGFLDEAQKEAKQDALKEDKDKRQKLIEDKVSRENLNDDYTRPTDKIQLNDKQLKNREKTIENDVVGSALYTLAGGSGGTIRRYGSVVGKAFDSANKETGERGKAIYVHRSAVTTSVVPDALYDKAAKILGREFPDLKYNAVMYDTTKPKRAGGVRPRLVLRRRDGPAYLALTLSKRSVTSRPGAGVASVTTTATIRLMMKPGRIS